MARLRIKNWKTFQHYDHRCPPWIKLHFKILSSRDWVSASDSERVLAIACMLVASQDEAKDGSFDADPEYIQRVAYLHQLPDFTPLIKRGFLEVIADASDCKQLLEKGCTETEKSREEKETETDGGELIFRIARSYPKSSQYRNQLQIPHPLQTAIMRAVQEDGEDGVMSGIAGYLASLDDQKFAEKPYEFFHEFHYRPEFWRTNAKPTKWESGLESVLEGISEADEEPVRIAGAVGNRQISEPRI